MPGDANVATDLHVTVQGEGRPVLLIHGFGANSFTWSKIAPGLAAENTVITVDAKGSGRSPKPADDFYGLHDQAAAILAIIEARDLRELTIVGHSMGGGISLLLGLELHRNHPGRLRQLALIDCIAYRQLLPDFILALRAPVLRTLLTEGLPPEWLVRYVLSRAYRNPGKIENAFVEAYAAPLRDPAARRALLATARAIIPADIDLLAARYPEIRVPTLILWGDADRIVPLSICQHLVEAIRGARLVVIEKCGHIPQEEQPDKTLTLLQGFLRE
ncbi:MAG: alpha/beta hydrolase [Acidisphaera sp.]|nr:alpha/beta hydrolase [Acidisphaera sp.]